LKHSISIILFELERENGNKKEKEEREKGIWSKEDERGIAKERKNKKDA
jgi:hypothetical protein